MLFNTVKDVKTQKYMALKEQKGVRFSYEIAHFLYHKSVSNKYVNDTWKLELIFLR